MNSRQLVLVAVASRFPVALLAAALAVAPIGVDLAGHHLGTTAAWAKGGNSGNDHAHHGGVGGDPGDNLQLGSDPVSASSLGALNGAHASPNARTHAAPNSRVGRIATYAKVVQAENALAINPNDAAAKAYLSSVGLLGVPAHTAEQMALKRAANKPISDQIMDAVNKLLGL